MEFIFTKKKKFKRKFDWSFVLKEVHTCMCTQKDFQVEKFAEVGLYFYKKNKVKLVFTSKKI